MKKNATFTERRYDIDWIRIMLIFSVFLFHIGMFFNNFGWHIKNNERVSWLDPVMAYLHTWRMPLLFLVSGVGTYFALGKRSLGRFKSERSRKLLIPLIFGMFVIVPPQVYVEKHAQYGSFINFIPHITEGSYPQGNFSWHHLWFVLYLFICAMAAIPFILFLRSRFSNAFYTALVKASAYKGSFLVLAFPLYLSQEWLLRYFPPETHALVNDWAYIAYNFLFFIYGYILLSNNVLISRIIEQRRIYGSFAFLLTGLFFFDYFNSTEPYINNSLQLFLKCLLELSIALSIIGYAAKYINRDHSWRKHLNEAIYPFYILHQTAIIVIGYYLAESLLPVSIKAIILALGSFIICVVVYLLIIRPFNITRLFFGMHFKNPAKKKQKLETERLKIAS